MAAITITQPTYVAGTGGTWTVRTGTAQATTGQTDWITPPDWAKYATIYLNVTATAGTTPLTDFSIREADPVTANDTYAFDMAGWNGITQVADTTGGVIVVYVGPGSTGIADDDTAAVYSLNTVLPRLMGFKVTLDRTTGNETYTYTLRVRWSK